MPILDFVVKRDNLIAKEVTAQLIQEKE